MSEGLPEGWSSASLEEVIGATGLFVDGDWVESKDQDPNGDVRLIQLADVGDGEYRNRSDRHLTSDKALELGCTYLCPGDVLIARMPDPLGRACMFPGDPKQCVTVVDVCIVRPGPGAVDPLWLMHFVNAPGFRKAMEEFERGTTRKRISRSNLGQLHLPVPPFTEQRRLVAKMEVLMAEVSATRTRLAKVLLTLKRFRQAVLVAACSGALTQDWRGGAETGWGEERLEDLTDAIQYGYTASAVKREEGPRFLRITDIQNGRVDWGQVPSCQIEPAVEAKYLLRPGDIVFARSGATTGKSFLVRECPRAVFASYLIRVRANERVSPQFLALFFQSPAYWAHITDNLSGNAQPNCNGTKLAELLVPVPSREEQHEIVRRVDALFALADVIERRVAAATARADKVPQAILTKAFRGELVPTEAELARAEGRAYEPASELLARIRKEREAAGVKGGRAKGKGRRAEVE